MRKLLFCVVLVFVLSCLFGCSRYRSPAEEDFYDHLWAFSDGPDSYLDIYVSKKVDSYDDALSILTRLVYDDGYVSQNDAEDAIVYLLRFEEEITWELVRLLNEYKRIR